MKGTEEYYYSNNLSIITTTTIIITIVLQLRKARLREIKQVAHIYTARKLEFKHSSV